MTDLFFSSLRKDPTIKRHLLKTVSWRLVGTIDTVLLGFIITGKLSTGLKIGALELITKMLLYFVHERVWHRIAFGLPGKVKRAMFFNKKHEQVFRQRFAVSRRDREKLTNQSAYTIWFTGLSGSGKSTLASALDQWCHSRQLRSYVIDGDNTRIGINSDLDFSREGRQENIRRVAEICKLFNEAGVIVISSFISPFSEDREQAKRIIGENDFKEIFIDAPLATCRERDTKGLYKLADEGKIRDFTGISSPYEAPEKPALHVQTDGQTIGDSLLQLTRWMEREGIGMLHAPDVP